MSGDPIRIWHDDVRPAPEGWLWCKTNQQAEEAFAWHDVEAISLDHDLGAIPTGDMDPTEVLFLKGSAEETGLDLVRWMVENDCVPAEVSVHSWNPDGARRMAAVLTDAGHDCALAPFRLPVVGLEEPT